MNIDEIDLARHPVVARLTQRIEALERQLQAEHEKLVKLEHEHEHDHVMIEKLEHKPIYAPPKPTRIAVGL